MQRGNSWLDQSSGALLAHKWEAEFEPCSQLSRLSRFVKLGGEIPKVAFRHDRSIFRERDREREREKEGGRKSGDKSIKRAISTMEGGPNP